MTQLTFKAFEGTRERPRQVATTDEVSALLTQDCVVACGVSGGKDSVACALAVAAHLEAIGHKGPRALIHSSLGRSEWRDSLPSCERLAAKLGWELIVVRRKAGDMLQRWQTRWHNNIERYADLECAKLILPWSTPAMRFCTSELKVAPIAAELRRRYPSQPIVNASGIRRQESAQRSRMPVSERFKKLERKNAIGLTWNAIIEWDIEEVFAEIAGADLALHEAYTTYGASRVSCAFCIMSALRDLQAGVSCTDNHDLYRSMVELEAESTFAFQGARWLADVAPHLLSPALQQRVQRAKAGAAERQAAESAFPADLLYEKGWPSRTPTLAEAQIVADIRREVGEAVGIMDRMHFLTAEEVRERFASLMAEKQSSTCTRGSGPRKA